MSVNQDIISTLALLNVPISFQTYNGKGNTYITFFTYLDKTEQFADDKEIINGQYIQLDIWSKSDYTELVNEVHNLMIEAGFVKISFYDLYEKDLKVYHKVMRYRIEKEER